MATAQVGIFAVGTAAHCYLEFDARAGIGDGTLVTAVAGLSEPRTTVGGVNLVIGVRPELWARVAPAASPAGVTGFNVPMVGPDGFTMPATQHDLWLWVAGAAQDLVFDVAADIIATVAPYAELASEVTGWSYRHSRDLTGFEDGTENPSVSEAVQTVIVPAGQPGAGASVLLVQQWAHDAQAWNALGSAGQERAMGRTKAESVEFDEAEMPADAHVARTVIENDGQELEIFRRNTPYGTVSEHGTMFVGFSVDQARLRRMLARMSGVEDGVRDALTRYTTPLTGAYYIVPSICALAEQAPATGSGSPR
jgi:putative iron-dependent peroxidase